MHGRCGVHLGPALRRRGPRARRERARPPFATAWIAGLLLAIALVTPLGAHDLERTTVHLDVAADGAFTLRLAHDPSWLLLRMASFAGLADVSPADAAARDARLRQLAPAAIDRVVLFVEFADDTGAIVRHEVRPGASRYDPPPDQVPAGEFALAAYTLTGRLPAGARALRWYYGMVADPYPFTLTLPDGSSRTEWVQGDAWSTTLPLGGTLAARPWQARLLEYLRLGYTHILPKGLDHLLFVAGLFLLAARLRPVLVQVTTFTVAHSVTLGLALYGVVSLPSRVVEPLIALSIVYVAVENLRTTTLSPGRVLLVFLFGLLHGLGFAGVLTGLALPRSDVALGLAGFNLGVEGGQLTVIALLAMVPGCWRDRPWYRARVVVPASMAIALVGAYWTVTRVFGW